MYQPRNWLIAVMPGRQDLQEQEGTFVGGWAIDDSGDVPPRWKIGGPKSGLRRPNGVALMPKEKEISIPDMRMNAVLTFRFPEIF